MVGDCYLKQHHQAREIMQLATVKRRAIRASHNTTIDEGGGGGRQNKKHLCKEERTYVGRQCSKTGKEKMQEATTQRHTSMTQTGY